MLVSLAVLAVVALALQNVLDSALGGAQWQRDRQELLAQARFAMDYMSRFVRETNGIVLPAGEVASTRLEVYERALDTYVNASRIYSPTGEAGRILDADANMDGLVHNDPLTEPAESVVFWVDASDPGNPRLMERRPNYATVAPGDSVTLGPLCEAVESFVCRRLSSGVVEMRLTLARGDARVSLRTCARARLLE